MTGHLEKKRTALLAEAVNFLSDDPDRSNLTSDEGVLWEAMLAAVGGSGSRLDLSVRQMMAATWNALEPGANASHLRMGEGELLAGIVNALNGDSAASHLTNSVSELYSMLRDASEEGLGPRIVLTGNTIAEDASVGDLVGTLSVSNGSGSYSFTMTATGGGKFALDGVDDTRVEVAAGLDYETATSHQITIEADNGVDPVLERTFTIAVTNVLEVTLNALTLDTDEIEEGSAEDTVVGAIQGKSSGSTLALTDSAGNRFKLSGTNIVAGPVATDFDLATSHNITVRETHADGSNSPRDSDIPITVTEAGALPAPDAPTLTLTSGATDNTPNFLVEGDLEVDDTVTFFAYSDVGLTTLVDTGIGTVTEAGTLTVSNVLGPLADDDYWYVAITSRDGHEDSDQSNTENNTIDATAPTLSSPSGTATGETTADLSVSTNEANGILYVVVTQSATPPSAAQVIAGQDHASAAADFADDQVIGSTGSKDFSATGLTADTEYWTYFVHEDSVGNRSSVSAASSFTTDAASEEAETTAWVNAVVGDGGSVSSGRRTVVNDLIVSLKADGIWSKLDRLYLFAAENSQSARRDLKAAAATTLSGSPTFTTDRGYVGGSGVYIDTGFNASTAGGNYTQNSAHLGVWQIADVDANDEGVQAIGLTASGNDRQHIYTRHPAGNAFFRANCDGAAGVAVASPVGFYVANRSAAGAWQGYKDGSSVTSGTDASQAIDNLNFAFPGQGSPNVDRIAMGSFGSSLSSGEVADFHTHLTTYLTAVGALP